MIQILGGTNLPMSLICELYFLVAVSGATYNYTIGVDRTDIQLLCDIPSSSAIEDIRWSINGTFPNPLNLFQHRNILQQFVNTSIECIDISQSNVILSRALISIQGLLYFHIKTTNTAFDNYENTKYCLLLFTFRSSNNNSIISRHSEPNP